MMGMRQAGCCSCVAPKARLVPIALCLHCVVLLESPVPLRSHLQEGAELLP